MAGNDHSNVRIVSERELFVGGNLLANKIIINLEILYQERTTLDPILFVLGKDYGTFVDILWQNIKVFSEV